MELYLPGQKNQFRNMAYRWLSAGVIFGFMVGAVFGILLMTKVSEMQISKLETRVEGQKEEIAYLLGCIGLTYGKDASKIMIESMKTKKGLGPQPKK